MTRRLIVVAALIALPVLAQPGAQTGRIPTVTRLVKIFFELETTLASQARAGNAAALEPMLDPAFEMREGAAPGTPVPRDEWLRRIRSSRGGEARIEQMAVHDLGTAALVSFRSVDESKSRKARFIVDYWKRDGERWILAVRYSSEVATSATRRSPPGTIDKRY